MVVRRSGSRCSGWLRPLSSVQRASSFAGPAADGVQSSSQNRQQNGFSSPVSLAGAHVLPPSLLNSTRLTLFSPAHAAPATLYGLPTGTSSCVLGRAIAAFG